MANDNEATGRPFSRGWPFFIDGEEQHTLFARLYKIRALWQRRQIERRLRLAIGDTPDKHPLTRSTKDRNSFFCAFDHQIASRGVGVDKGYTKSILLIYSQLRACFFGDYSQKGKLVRI
jgi:hypothetical protein